MTPTADGRPAPAQDVALEVPGVGRLSARVEEVEPQTVTLLVTTKSPPPAGPATLEFTSARGLHRLPGVVAPDADVIRFEQRLEPKLVQRREFARAQAMVHVLVWPDSRPGIEVHATALNISGGGMLLAGGHGMHTDETFAFELSLVEQAPPVRGRGRVVREHDRGGAGVAFDGVPEEARERVVHFVFERQRRERLVAG